MKRVVWMLALCPLMAMGQDDAALVAPEVKMSPGKEYGPDTRIFQGIPTLERSKGGRLRAAWYGGGPGEGPENYVMLTTSGDDGKSWSELKLVIDPPGPVRAFDNCLWVDPAGRLWLFWAQSYEWFDGRVGVWAITCDQPDNENAAWSAPRRLCDGIMMNKPTVLSDGRWLAPVGVWNRATRSKNSHDLGEERKSRAMVSGDQGKTWSVLGAADVPERTFDENMIVERNDKSLWMLVRTKYGIGQSVSTDGGKTWSAGEKSAIPHIDARFFIRRLASGKLLLVKHTPPEGKKARSHLMAYVSDDDGKTWKGGLMLDERNGVSYPDGAQAADGRIFIVYDYSRTKEMEILTAVFTEADVLAGTDVSGKVVLRQVVNKAVGKR